MFVNGSEVNRAEKGEAVAEGSAKKKHGFERKRVCLASVPSEVARHFSPLEVLDWPVPRPLCLGFAPVKHTLPRSTD